MDIRNAVQYEDIHVLVRRRSITLQLYGLGLNLVTLASIGLPTFHAPLLLSLGLGVAIGLLASQRLAQQTVRGIVLGLAGLGGVLIFIRGLT